MKDTSEEIQTEVADDQFPGKGQGTRLTIKRKGSNDSASYSSKVEGELVPTRRLFS